MQRLLISLTVLLCLLAGIAPTALAQNDDPFDRARTNYCSLGTVQGNYSFTSTGYLYPGLPDFTAPALSFNSIGVLSIDGAGGASYRFNRTIGGQGAATTALSAPVVGRYTVNSNCTGRATFPDNETYFFVITENGHEIFIISTTPGTVITATARRQGPPSPQAQPPAGPFPRAYTCSPGSLRGTYALIGSDLRLFPNFAGLPPGIVLPPQGVAVAAVNIQYFDGAGNSNLLVEVDSNAGLIEQTDPDNLPPPTRYTVNADCTGTYRTFGGIDASLVVLDGGREFRVLPTTPGVNGYLTWKKISDARMTP